MIAYPMSAEVRIAKALLLAPMTSGQLAKCLDLEPANVQRRLGYLVEQGEAEARNIRITAKPQRAYVLTARGKVWAKEIGK